MSPAPHSRQDVRFQKKAWANEPVCQEYASEELYAATALARAAGERSVTFFDNLSGQTTEEHLRLCQRARSPADRHLLPTGSTGELMFIDGGIGACVKNLIGDEQDEWLEDTDHLERWTTSPLVGGLQAWEKRVLVSQWAGRAWEKLCDSYDFVGSARALGMLITADGSDDDKIKVQGLTGYTFTDADGGSEGEESVVDEGEDELADVLEEGEEGEEGEGEGEEYQGGMESSDEVDDTAAQLWACGEAPATAHSGYVYSVTCPSLERGGATARTRRPARARRSPHRAHRLARGQDPPLRRLAHGEAAVRDRQLQGGLHEEGDERRAAGPPGARDHLAQLRQR